MKKLNEVKGVRGIRRFFKQVAQSAKGTDQDDFLGCVTIPIQVDNEIFCKVHNLTKDGYLVSTKKRTLFIFLACHLKHLNLLVCVQI